MKTLWTIIALVAVINILAIAGLLGWLKATNRLNQDRVTLVRQTFAKTISAEMQEKAAQAAAAEDQKKKDAEAERMARPPETAADKIEKQRLDEEQRLQLIQRKQQELESLRSSLMTELAKLDAREKKLADDKAAFAAERAKIAETEGAKQFKDALLTLEGQKPKDAKQVLKAMIDGKQKDQAVSYLAKMEDGKRSKVMAEFVKDDAALAADLLERLRTRGTVVPVADSSHADQRQAPATTAANSANPALPNAGPAPAGSQSRPASRGSGG